MERERDYKSVRLVGDTLKAVNKYIDDLGKKEAWKTFNAEFSGDETWVFDNFDEFIAEYDRAKTARYSRMVEGLTVTVQLRSVHSIVSVKAPAREEIQKVFNIVDSFVDRSKLPEEVEDEHQPTTPTIFIGHGRSSQWRDLKDHLHEKHGYEIEAYEIGARAGHAIRDILEEMLENSSFALLVLTGEDETANRKIRARQNVIHEAGLFQGRLGFSRAIMLLEKGVEEFLNADGIQQIRFAKGNIKETFGEVLATLEREFED
jgi:predicted nucleotide-binding protein